MTHMTTIPSHGKSFISAVKIRVSIFDPQHRVEISRLEICCSFEVAGKRHTTARATMTDQRRRFDTELERMVRMVSDMLA